MKIIKAHNGEEIKVDSDHYKKAIKHKWYVHVKDGKYTQIVNSSGKSITRVLFAGIWDENDFKSHKKLGDPLDCQSRNYVLAIAKNEQIKIRCSKDNKVKWGKLAKKESDSLSNVVRDLLNDECDKQGIK